MQKEDSELEFDIRRQRLQQLAQWTNKSEKDLYQLYQKRTRKAAEDWFNSTLILWKAVQQYVDPESEKVDKIKELRNDLTQELDKDNGDVQLSWKKVEKFHDQIHHLRIEEAGLDIPKSTSYDPETAGVEGLIE